MINTTGREVSKRCCRRQQEAHAISNTTPLSKEAMDTTTATYDVLRLHSSDSLAAKSTHTNIILHITYDTMNFTMVGYYGKYPSMFKVCGSHTLW